MRFEQETNIAASREEIWQYLIDVPKVATCVPGVETVVAAGDDRYLGTMKVRVGPIGLTLEGFVTVSEMDRENWTAEMRGEAKDKRAAGAVKTVVRMRLLDAPVGTTLRIETDATIMGRIGDFGQPVIRRKADQILGEFSRNLQRLITSGEPSTT